MNIGQNLRLYSMAFVIASLLLSACKSSTSQPQTQSTAPPSSSSGSPPSTPSSSGQSSGLPSPSSSSPSSSSPSSGSPSSGGPSAGMPSSSGPSAGMPSTGGNSSSIPGSSGTSSSSGSSQPGVTVSSSRTNGIPGLPGPTMPSTGSSPGSSGIPGSTSSTTSGAPGQAGSLPGSNTPTSSGLPGAELPGDSSVFDTAQPGQQSGDVDFSESSQSSPGQSDGQSGSEQAGNAPYSPGATSRNEQVAVLDGELEGSMGEYDGMILRERKYVLARGNEAGSEGDVEDFDRSLEYYDEGEEEGGAPSAPGNPGDGGDSDTGGLETGQSNGDGTGSGNSRGGPGSGKDGPFPPPEGIPSGNDDDVVARQMREAALFEPDPQLRKDLWEAYRKYKEDTR